MGEQRAGAGVDKVAGGYCVEEVKPGVYLDSRLAIVDRCAGWMALADLHYGYEVSRRAEGGLFPLWGMATVEERVDALLDFHRPDRLILVGDVVDSRMGMESAAKWLGELGTRVELICVKGNHDRGAILEEIDFVDWHREEGYLFHHGHRKLEELALGDEGVGNEVEVVGHFHPSISLRDGAGTVLRLPALVEDEVGGRWRWVLPAFSPWAGGGRIEASSHARYYGCGGGRIIVR